MELVTPGIGLIFWTFIVFILLIILLKKFAWKPILEAVKTRTENIEKALAASEEAKLEIEKLTAKQNEIHKQSLADRDFLLKEAADTKIKIISEAKTIAKEQTEKILSDARETIENEKSAAVIELKNHVAQLSLDIAEKIVKEQLSSSDKQKALVDNLVKGVNLN